MSKEFQRVPLERILSKYDIKGVHPAAELLPMDNEEGFQASCADVEMKGFFESIKITDDGLLIDGRNRLQVAWALKLDPVIERYNPTDPVAYVISENVIRRHLDVGQRALIAEKLASLKNGSNQYKKVGLTNVRAMTQEEACELFSISPKSISQARTVKQWAPELIKEIESGGLALESAYKEASTKKKKAHEKDKPEPEAKPQQPMLQLTGIIDKKLVEVPYPAPRGKHAFNRTNDAVDWASWTWNPVTGCNHGCPYCYARELAYRDSYKAAYPIQFAPLFHHERLDDPVNTVPGNERPQDGRVFVCSMADLFGEWVPQDWIDAVFEATLRAPEWEYLFLTKFPQRYRRINLPPKAWFGASVDMQKRVKVTEKFMANLDVSIRWISVEPMLEPLKFSDLSWCDLIVIGAQSETHQPDGFLPAFAPQHDWVVDLINQARAWNVPVYLKPNLLGEPTGSKPGMQLSQEQPRRREFGELMRAQ